MARRIRLVACLATAVVAGSVAYAVPAAAQPVTTGATAYSAPAATGTATLAASLSLSGTLGGLLNSLITPIVNTALNPLVAALQGSLNSTLLSVLGSSSSLTAGTPSTQDDTHVPGTFPNDLPGGLPSPCGVSTTQPCYHGVSTSVSGAPLASLSLSGLSGYTEEAKQSLVASNPIFGRTQVLSPSISVLPGISALTSPLVSAGTIDAKANCPNDGSTAPSASVSAANVSLLGGLITLGVLNGQIASLVVNGTSYSGVSAVGNLKITNLPVINIANIVVQSYGTALKVTIPLTVAQVLAGLGLAASAVTELTGDAVAGTGLSLSVVIGPNVQVTSTTAKAWGLGIGVDLSGSLNFTLLGLVGATVTAPTGITGSNYGNLLDARLGYAACGSGSATTSTSTPNVPPALV